jgi:hypothetical protein
VTSLTSMLIALEQRGMGSVREVLFPHFLVAVWQTSVSAYWPTIDPGSAADACGAGLLGCSCDPTVTGRQQATRIANRNDRAVLRLR